MATSGNKVIPWVCTKCGKKLYGKEKPGATQGGKCKNSPAGTHSYVKA